jgi:hypothetical protein
MPSLKIRVLQHGMVHHVMVRPRLAHDIAQADELLRQIGALGISFGAVTDKLLEAGGHLIVDALDGLLKSPSGCVATGAEPRIFARSPPWFRLDYVANSVIINDLRACAGAP